MALGWTVGISSLNGLAVGFKLRVFNGGVEGVIVGILVGEVVGLFEGPVDGNIDGVSEGFIDGSELGCFVVGEVVGANEGENGWCEGRLLGLCVALVGRSVGLLGE